MVWKERIKEKDSGVLMQVSGMDKKVKQTTSYLKKLYIDKAKRLLLNVVVE